MIRYFLALTIALGALTAPAAAAKPCAVVSNAEASKYAGVAVTGKAYGMQCRYTARGANVSVGVGTITGSTAKAQFDGMKAGSTPVSGLGYPAYFVAGSIMAMKNGTLVVTSLITNAHDATAMNPQLPSLARLVLGRL